MKKSFCDGGGSVSIGDGGPGKKDGEESGIYPNSVARVETLV